MDRIVDSGTNQMARVLIEMGNIAISKEIERDNKNSELEFEKTAHLKTKEEKKQLLIQLESSCKDKEMVTAQFRKDINGKNETIDSLKLERQMMVRRNMDLFQELQEWRLKYPKDAKKFRKKYGPICTERREQNTNGCNIPGPDFRVNP